jgi:hypothetical protein
VRREREAAPRVPFDRLAAGFFAAGLRAAVLREAPAVEDFARVEADFFAVLLFAAERFAVERFADVLRAPPLERAEPDEEPELVLAVPSTDHLPVMTRCAASATASAISEPNLVALAITLVAA